MKFICFLPSSLIDWAATGAMISAVATLVIGFFQCIQSMRLKKIESDIEERKLKVELFDKYHEVYSLFVIFFNACEQLIEDYGKRDLKGEVSFEAREEFMDALSSDFNNLSGFFAKQDYLAYLKEHGDDLGFCKDKIILLYQKSDFLNKKFFRESLDKLKMANFLFSSEISDVVIKFAEILLKDIFIESKANDENQRENEEHWNDSHFFEKIKKSVEEIKSKDIVRKMENEIGKNNLHEYKFSKI